MTTSPATPKDASSGNTAPEITIHPQGTMLELTREVPRIGRENQAWSEGTRFTVEEFVPAAVEDGVSYPDSYNGSARGGFNNIDVPVDATKLVLSAQQMDQRTIPTSKDIMSELSSALHINGDSFNVNQTEPGGAREIECYGSTDDGLDFGFTVTISEPQRTDF